jgi:arylsulfatase A-like enzyme
MYIHLMSSHVLGPDKEKFSVYQPKLSFVGRLRRMKEHSAEKVTLATNAYDNGVLQTDYYLSEIFRHLREKAYLEDSIIVLTGDHGDGLGERGYYDHTYELYQEHIRVPMIFYAGKNNLALRNVEYASHIDIAPTIVDYLDLPRPKTWQGISLLKERAADRVTYHQTLREIQELAVIYQNSTGLYKLMATKKGEEIGNFRLFELRGDGGEKENLMESASADLVRRLKAYLIGEFGRKQYESRFSN